MKKINITKVLGMGILSLILLGRSVCLADGEGLQSPISPQTLQELIDLIIDFLFYLGFLIAPLMIIYAGFLMVTAAGDVDRINRAKAIIFWALVATSIILLAKGLPSAIKEAMGG